MDMDADFKITEHSEDGNTVWAIHMKTNVCLCGQWHPILYAVDKSTAETTVLILKEYFQDKLESTKVSFSVN